MPRKLTRDERKNAKAFVDAVRAEPNGPALQARVRLRQELLLSKMQEWTWLSYDAITMLYRLLGGPVSTSRHLRIHPSTIHEWRRRGRMPTTAYKKALALIAKGVKPLVRSRHAHRNNI